MNNFAKKLAKTSVLVFVVVWSLFASLFLGVILTLVFGLGLGLALDSPIKSDLELEQVAGNELADHQFVSVPIEGLILGEKLSTDSFLELFSELGITYGYEVKDYLVKLADENKVEGVILEVHSPGGTIYGTQAIVDGVEYYRQKTGKPVIAYVGSIAASGGYWATLGADQVVADYGTSIGSIGVIMGPFKYYDQVMSEDGGLLGTGVETAGGVFTEYISSGKYKDLGNPYRPLTDDERQVLQQGADLAYQQFVSQVVKNRGLSESVVKDQVGALIYSEDQALELGLIDQIGSRDDAYQLLADRSGVDHDDFKIMRKYKEVGFIDSLLSSFSYAKNRQAAPLFCNQATTLVYMGNPMAYCQ